MKEAELHALRGHHRSNSNRGDYGNDSSNLRHRIAEHSPASIRNKAVMESADYQKAQLKKNLDYMPNLEKVMRNDRHSMERVNSESR